MEILCTRTGCTHPQNSFPDLHDKALLKTVQQKYCLTCGMQLILLGRYLPVKLLGQGGFGAAFLACDRYTPGIRKCVVKQFQPAADFTPQQLKLAQNLFEREGEVLEHLGVHLQIPDLYAYFEISAASIPPGKEDKFFYIVQEFIDGQTLEEELREKGKFSSEEVLEVLREILPVLKYVHDNNTIHRDIKPSNIMRHRNGMLYLLDFGAVKKAAAGGVTATSSTGIYSMWFAPPEQMTGGVVYPSTDLYALAVTCIQLLTGKPPTELFDGLSNQWRWRNFADIDSHLADVLDRMLLAAPNQRFQSAREALEALSIPAPQPQEPENQLLPPQVLEIQEPETPPPPPPQPQPWGVLKKAAFTGFEGGLLFIALGSLLKSRSISMGLLGMILGGLIFAQYRQMIKGKDLAIISGITLAAVVLVQALHKALPISFLVMVPILAAACAIALTALFALVYKTLSNQL